MDCIYCKDVGTLEGCSYCKRIKKRSLSAIKLENKTLEKGNFFIPEYYRERNWTIESFRDYILINPNDKKLNYFGSQLQSVLNCFIDGSVYKRSAFISAPIGHSKTVFAYTCLKVAQSQGKSISNILTLEDILCMIKPMYSNGLKPTLNKFDYLKDVLFVRIDCKEQSSFASSLILSLLATRSEANLSTYFISNVSSYSLYDCSHIQPIIKNKKETNSQKYLSFIEYKKEG